MPWIDFTLLALSLAGLWVGTNISVNHAVSVAKHLGLSEFFIGLTIISIGTDLPEMVVSITGSVHRLKGEETSGLIIGNAIGSSLGQMGLALAIASFFYRMTLDRTDSIRDGTMLGVSTFVLMMLATDGVISRVEGVLLVVIFLVYVALLLSQEKKKVLSKPRNPVPGYRTTWTILALLGGLAIVVIASEWTIKSALHIADYYHIRQSLIGIFIVGLGTSLPELAVSIGGIFKGSPGISGGTVIGSTIFDILVPIGMSAAIANLQFDKRIADFDIPAFLIIALLVFAFFLTRKGISKVEASIILVLYVLYAWLKIAQT